MSNEIFDSIFSKGVQVGNIVTKRENVGRTCRATCKARTVAHTRDRCGSFTYDVVPSNGEVGEDGTDEVSRESGQIRTGSKTQYDRID